MIVRIIINRNIDNATNDNIRDKDNDNDNNNNNKIINIMVMILITIKIIIILLIAASERTERAATLNAMGFLLSMWDE